MEFTKPNSSYPLATKNGDSIPHEVSLPTGVVIHDFAAGGSSLLPSIPNSTAFICAEATEDCYLTLNASVSTGVNTNTVYIPKGVAIVFTIAAFSPRPVDWSGLRCVGGSEAGTVHLQLLSAWGQVGEDTQRSTM